MTTRISRVSSTVSGRAAFVLLLLSFGTAAPAQVEGIGHGTAVVVLRSPKAIFAAVDSKLTIETSRDGVRTFESGTHCKVRRVGPYYSIIAGIAGTTNGFDAQDEVARSFRAGDDLAALANAVLQSLPKSLAPKLQELRASDPAFLSSSFGDAALNLTLLGRDRGVPRVFVDQFSVIADGMTIRVTGRAMSCPGDCPAANAGYFLGEHEATESAVRLNPSILLHPDEQQVEKLIHLEYASRPDVVGGPLSVIKVTPSADTVLLAGACTDGLSATRAE